MDQTTDDAIGVIGIGTIGEHFVEWLLEAGYDVVGYDVDEDRLAVAEDVGAATGEHPADVTARVDVVVLSLPGSQYVEAVMEGEDGVLDTLEAGGLVIDTGTSRPDTEVHYERVCAARGAGYLDSPLTWGGPGEKPTMFVGGAEEQYERARPIIEELSHSHRRFGGIGKGQVMKAGHRLRQNNRAAVDAEMVEFLRNNGVDPEAAADLMEWSFHDRFFAEDFPSTEGWRKALAEEDPETGSLSGNDYGIQETGARPRLRESHWAKDHAYGIEIGHSSNTALPVSSAVYHAMLMSENYASALFDRDLSFQDEDWYDRGDPISHFRRLNRPAEEWRRVDANED